LFASLLFTGLFLANLFLVFHLTFDERSRQYIDEAFRASLTALRPAGAEAGDALLGDSPAPAAPAEACAPGDPVSSDDVAPCAPKGSSLEGGVFRSLSMRVERALFDTRGRVIWRDFWQGSVLDRGDHVERHSGPDHDRVREEWEVGGRPRPVLALREPSPPGGNDIREVGIPEDLIEQELSTLERRLQTKLWIGAAAAGLILLIAFLYVLRLIKRTRLLEAQAQMDDRLAYVGGLAAGLAHEIRNPLNVLSMNLQMLEEDVVARLGGEAGDTRQYMATLQGEIRRLSSLVDNFLSYARPGQPRFESRDLNQVIEDTCLLVRPQFDAKGVHLVQELSAFLPPVDLDEPQIRQALMNILINAVQILKPGGTVAVQTAVAPDGGVVVSVTDDGPGIKPADRERIFDVFYSNRPGGTGLGLAIAGRVLAAHGGRISVEAGPGGRGARFILKLPRRHEGVGAAAPGGAVATSRSS
jgi:signal transduction histidine kinase